MKTLFAFVSFLLFGPGLPAAASQFPAPYNSERDTEAAPPAAEEALKMLELPEGFRATLFASEPEVQNPIAMAWDRRGRLWIAENYTYAERSMRFDLNLRDRLLIFEDTDGDGRADRRTVFSDDLQMLTSVEPGVGGVWVMCPPRLLFLPDRDGDDVPDAAPEVVLDGFTVAESNYHNFANGLRWGPDGWLYGRCGHSCPGNVGAPGTVETDRIPIKGGIWRYHPERKVFEGLTHGTTNPWGHDWDRHGELFFINTVTGHLWHGIPGAHFVGSSAMSLHPYAYERIDTHADHYHYDRSGKWTESRDGAANEFGGGHAHIGMMIYQGRQWPERFHDRLFTINMHGRRTNVERLDRAGSGFVGRHEPDIFLMGDPWYRGLDIRPGPDGSVFMIDWSDTGECHDHTGVHRTSGRIYRISYGEPEAPSFAGTPEEWLFHENPWFAGSMRRGGFEPDHGTLREVLQSTGKAEHRLRAMWALHRAGEAAHQWVPFLDDGHESLRAWAVRLLFDREPIDTILGPRSGHLPAPQPPAVFEKLEHLAREDESGLVRLALASSLQRLPFDQRAVLGLALAARNEDADDHNLPAMVWYGISPLTESDPDALIEIAGATSWPKLLRWIGRGLSSRVGESTAPLEKLLSVVERKEAPLQFALLQGISDGTKGRRKASKPANWDEVAEALAGEIQADAPAAALLRELRVLFGDGRALDEIKAVVLNQELDGAMRRAALETWMEERPDDLREFCESLLEDRILNATAVRGLAFFDDPGLGAAIAKQYRRFLPDDRSAVIEVLVTRSTWAAALLDEMAAGRIAKSDLSAFQARQIRSLEDAALSQKLASVWGDVRESSAEKRALIEAWTAKLTPEVLAGADLSRGRQTYAAVCSACHILYGEGGKIGPDLTGSGRSDLSYLLENIFDPGAVVDVEYRMSLFTTKDDRVLSGVVVAEDEKTVHLRQTAGEVKIARAEIERREVLPLSMMPEGLLLSMEEDQVRDLIAYLMHPVQVP